jgi:hypothetical protein
VRDKQDPTPLLVGGAVAVVGILGLFFLLRSKPAPAPDPELAKTTKATPKRPATPTGKTPARSPSRVTPPRPTPSQSTGRELSVADVLRYDSLVLGQRRVYSVRLPQGSGIEVEEVVGTRSFAGREYSAKHSTFQGLDAPETTRYVRVGADGVYVFDPALGREERLLPAPLRIGHTWTLISSSATEKHSALSVETITVRGVRYEDVLAVRFVAEGRRGVKYLAPGVGLVRERLAGGGQSFERELIADHELSRARAAPSPVPSVSPSPSPSPSASPSPGETPPDAVPAAGDKGQVVSAAELARCVLPPAGLRVTLESEKGGRYVLNHSGPAKLGGQSYLRSRMRDTFPDGRVEDSMLLRRAGPKGILQRHPQSGAERVQIPAPLRVRQSWKSGKWTTTYMGKGPRSTKKGLLQDVLWFRSEAPGLQISDYLAPGLGLVESTLVNTATGKTQRALQLTLVEPGKAVEDPPANPKKKPDTPRVEELEELGKGWWLYTSKDGSITVEFPGKPTIAKATQVVGGRKASGTRVSFVHPGTGAERSVSHLRFPPGTTFPKAPPALLKDTMGAAIRALNVLRTRGYSARAIRQGKLVGSEGVATLLTGGGQRAMRMRILLNTKVMYKVLFIDPGSARSKGAKRFFRSLKIKKES